MLRFVWKIVAATLLTSVWIVLVPLTLVIALITAIKSPEAASDILQKMFDNIREGYDSLLNKG